MMIDFLCRLFVSALLGGLIGLEREYRAKEAGIRTHFLVALGSALFMILSQYGFDAILSQLDHASFDPSRIASQVVTGIGFIGAGTIIFQKHVVKGLTTAAGLWVTSAIGLTCGAGLYVLASAATVMVLLCLEALNMLIHKVGTRELMVTIASPTADKAREIVDEFCKREIDIIRYGMQAHDGHNGTYYQVSMEIRIKRNQFPRKVLEFMEKFDGITVESIEG